MIGLLGNMSLVCIFSLVSMCLEKKNMNIAIPGYLATYSDYCKLQNTPEKWASVITAECGSLRLPFESLQELVNCSQIQGCPFCPNH